MDRFEVPVSLRMRGSPASALEAWMKPEIASQWLCDRLVGEWSAGNTVTWWFGEHSQSLDVTEVVPDQLIRFRWRAYGVQPETEVQIQFREIGPEVGISVKESSYSFEAESIRQALDAACGWENLLCRLKVWLETGARFENGGFWKK